MANIRAQKKSGEVFLSTLGQRVQDIFCQDDRRYRPTMSLKTRHRTMYHGHGDIEYAAYSN